MPVNHLVEIERAITYIENNLTEEISLSSIAHEVGFSMYHFHRFFKGEMGESPCEYLRERRLYCAASDLTQSQASISDIALRYRFSSQSAFSRAFSMKFGLPPGEYRRRSQALNTLQVSESKFIQSEQTLILGIKRCCSFSHGQILRLWNQFMSRIGEISTTQSFALAGLYQNLRPEKASSSTRFCYLAGVLINSPCDLPDGMVCETIPATRYRVLSHEDTLRTFTKTHQQTFSAWLAKGRPQVQQPVIEVFDDNPFQDPVKYDIFFPVS